ncbi:phage regulatory CII family protein [Acetobacter persici]|uniref:phage regulatory CII family protein n=1 Tax=Acetobacter persici TaxID=1076596 RepID=UPI0039E8E8E4
MTAPYSHRFVPGLKTATKQAVEHVGGIDAAATISRVGRTQFSDYSNRQRDGMVPVDVALDLDHCAEKPLILAAMAHALGYVLIPQHVGVGDFGHDMGEFAVTSGEVLSTAVRILSDGRIDPHEADEIAPKLAHAKHIVERALACIHRVQTENRPHVVSDRIAG